MNKWTKAANARLTEIQAAQEGRNELLILVAAFAKLPPGQLKKILTEDIIAILAKYGVVME